MTNQGNVYKVEAYMKNRHQFCIVETFLTGFPSATSKTIDFAASKRPPPGRLRCFSCTLIDTARRYPAAGLCYARPMTEEGANIGIMGGITQTPGGNTFPL